ECIVILAVSTGNVTRLNITLQQNEIRSAQLPGHSCYFIVGERTVQDAGHFIPITDCPVQYRTCRCRNIQISYCHAKEISSNCEKILFEKMTKKKPKIRYCVFT